MIKYLLATLSISVVAALGMMVDNQSQQATTPTRVAHNPSTMKIFAAGRIEGASDEIELRSLLSGRIVAIDVHEGQQVSKGQPLLRVDDEQYRQEVALAKAQLELSNAALQRLHNGARTEERDEARHLLAAADANLERAKLNWNRIKQLHVDGAVSQQDRDNHRTRVSEFQAQQAAAKSRLKLVNAPARKDEVAMAQAKIAAARARLQLAVHALEKATIKSPVDGTILKVHSRPGELAAPDADRPCLLLADTSAYRVRAFVEEIDAPRVEVGMRVEVTADGMAGKTFIGHITRLSPRMSRKQIWNDDPAENYDTKTREVWVELQEGQGQLVLGLRVDVTISPAVNAETNEVAGQ